MRRWPAMRAVDPVGALPYIAASRSDGRGPGGGIGRRAGFRCQWLNGREGSSPFLGTTPTINRGYSVGARGDLATHVHVGDLPAGAMAGAAAVAIDSETMGLRLGRDPLCVVQL